ncbi:GH1 family beta-glucosidase [Cryptosporangium aurantiacum]|uniref:Beta-glucosidase n=1 Tax=Cryptosporangium aurantiacum TaxID=134849 RepID=A0A1M7N9M1_9ACTN|nr:GH1 family beta-glucosidase [Cryptosporangium aurantiacum]SHN00282.1 beta-glucosidase [Cryptosporangium aurantiacum]
MTGSEQFPQFPPDFVWGVATASYQIEGAVDEDGRGPSIWDTFSHLPGKTHNGDTGDVADDHYHRYAEDFDLMAGLGVDSYRFSIAWPRIQPTGDGPANPAGLDFYDRLVDTMLAKGITPAATLYHWDLPQALEDKGGWMQRDIPQRFAEYTAIVAERLGDRVGYWITLNEPFVVTAFGYALGTHAPGHRLLAGAFPIAHHQLLGHGLAIDALRAARVSGKLGVTNAMAPVHPATDDPADHTAAHILDLLHNRTYADPLLLGRYPDDVPAVYRGADLSVIKDGDLDKISTPLDFYGLNFYNPHRVRASGPENFGHEIVEYPGVTTTAMGWPVVPEAFTELLTGLNERYGEKLPPVYITENGAAYDDKPDADGRVQDDDRIAYLDSHLRAVHAAMAAGVDVRGYFCWSFLDNFEWAEGYAKRFGLVRVDYETQERTPKASYDWFRSVIARTRDAHGE